MIIAYKAFNKDLTCTMGKGRFQYQPGIWYQEDKANCASTGFHCAANPLDCLTYYPDMDQSRYWMVLADGDIDEDANDSKISCTRIRLMQELGIEDFVTEAVQYIADHPKLTMNSRVVTGEGRALQRDKFVIVRGKDPKAMGEIGTVLGFAVERLWKKDIEFASTFVVDGLKIKPGHWYNAEGKCVDPAPDGAVR